MKERLPLRVQVNGRIRTYAPTIFLFVVLALILRAILAVHPPSYLMPTFARTQEELQENLSLYLSSAWTTLWESILGFLAGNLISFIVSVMMFYFPSFEDAVMPYGIALKATPVVALIPFLVAMFGMTKLTVIFCVVLVSFFPLLVALPSALRRVDRDLVELFHSFEATRLQTFVHLRLRAVAPELFAALKTSSSLSVVGAIIGEFTSPVSGLGKLIVLGVANGIGSRLVCATLFTSLIGIIFFWSIYVSEVLVIGKGRLT